MVMVTNTLEKINSKTQIPFVLLELSGGLELVQSQSSGKFYATMRRCRVPSTFNLDVAKMLIGTTIPGDIVRVEVEPYEYVVASTGEVITLAHSYAFQPEGSMELLGQTNIEKMEMSSFSVKKVIV